MTVDFIVGQVPRIMEGVHSEGTICRPHAVSHPYVVIYRLGPKWHSQTFLTGKLVQVRFKHVWWGGGTTGQRGAPLLEFHYQQWVRSGGPAYAILASCSICGPFTSSFIILWGLLDVRQVVSSAGLMDWTVSCSVWFRQVQVAFSLAAAYRSPPSFVRNPFSGAS